MDAGTKAFRLLTLVSALFGMTSAFGVSVTIDKVQQRYPWNGKVDIDYTVSCADDELPLGANDFIRLTVSDGHGFSCRADIADPAPLPTAAGAHRVTWDADLQGVTGVFPALTVTASIAHVPPRFMVIDLSEGTSAEIYPVDFYDGEPPGGFNVNEYKTTKLVLRRIPAGSCMVGTPKGESGSQKDLRHPVVFTNDFYIGVFPVTQSQYQLVKGGNPSAMLDPMRPVDNVAWNDLRGSANVSTHQYDWPWNNEVKPDTFSGILRAKCRAKDASGAYVLPITGFDLPTEFQWEYACRAGTTTPFNDGVPCPVTGWVAAYEARMSKLGRYGGNVSDGAGGYFAGTTVVGSYLPNAWGLYDMHGQLYELCLDYGISDEAVLTLGQIYEPVGPETGERRQFRGGAYADSAATDARSGSRRTIMPDRSFDSIAYPGFRLACHFREGEVR